MLEHSVQVKGFTSLQYSTDKRQSFGADVKVDKVLCEMSRLSVTHCTV